MKSTSLFLAGLLTLGVSAPVAAGAFKLYTSSYHAAIVANFIDGNPRGAKCKSALTFYGAVEKAATPGYPYDVQYRWLTQAGPGPIKEIDMGTVEYTSSTADLSVPIDIAVNTSRVITAQLEMLKPYHLLSNKLTVTFQCKAMPPGQKVPTTKWPTQ
jgi:hypothetical protein